MESGREMVGECVGYLALCSNAFEVDKTVDSGIERGDQVFRRKA